MFQIQSSPGTSGLGILLVKVIQAKKKVKAGQSLLSTCPPSSVRGGDGTRISHDEICQGWGRRTAIAWSDRRCRTAGLPLDWALSRHERRSPSSYILL